MYIKMIKCLLDTLLQRTEQVSKTYVCNSEMETFPTIYYPVSENTLTTAHWTTHFTLILV